MTSCCRCTSTRSGFDLGQTRSDIYLLNRTSVNLDLNRVECESSLSAGFWGVASTRVKPGAAKQKILWIERSMQHKVHGDKNELHVTIYLGGNRVRLQHRLQTTISDDVINTSELSVQLSAGGQSTGWSSSVEDMKPISLIFPGKTDEHLYQITATGVQSDKASVSAIGEIEQSGDVTYTVTDRGSNCILPQIDHIVVLMFENRSLDNILGWIYPGDGKIPDPNRFIPTTSLQVYNGLNTGKYYNEHPEVNQGRPVVASCVTSKRAVVAPDASGTFEKNRTLANAIYRVPTVDPGEEFENVAEQIADDMKGFIANFVKQVKVADHPIETAASIMDCYHPLQVPVLSSLARSFAVSDAWFASVPSQTWPNRCFAMTGSSAGKVNNDVYQQASKGSWDIPTIFDLLEEEHMSWMVYKNSTIPSFIQAMFFEKYLFDEDHFRPMEEFRVACSQPIDAPNSEKLPLFTWLEPNFGGYKWFGDFQPDESYHPPYDIRPAEMFLSDIYETIRSSPYRDKILFLILFDEHGGTFDHVPPPTEAAPPYPFPRARDGSGFDFSRFGVRVPAVVISSYVTPGTVFRSTTPVPHDHTSLLSTVRDWRGLSEAFKTELSSPRIVAAPTLSPVLTESKPLPWPSLTIPQELKDWEKDNDGSEEDHVLNDIHKVLHLAAESIRRGEAIVGKERLELIGKLRKFSDTVKRIL